MDRATILELVGWVAFSRHSEREREREGRCRNHGVYWVETPSAGGDDGMAVDRK